jgi:hypothetical protein
MLCSISLPKLELDKRKECSNYYSSLVTFNNTPTAINLEAVPPHVSPVRHHMTLFRVILAWLGIKARGSTRTAQSSIMLINLLQSKHRNQIKYKKECRMRITCPSKHISYAIIVRAVTFRRNGFRPLHFITITQKSPGLEFFHWLHE